MFKEDLKRIEVCIEYKDYYSAMEYAMLVKENYVNQERKYLENIIKYVKLGEYQKIRRFDKFQHHKLT